MQSTFHIDFPVCSDLSNTSSTGFNTHMYFMWPLLSTSLNGIYMLLYHDPSHQGVELSGTNTITLTSLFASTRGLTVRRIISCQYVLWSIRGRGTKWQRHSVHIFRFLSVGFIFKKMITSVFFILEINIQP